MAWCEESALSLNTSKTKELVVSTREGQPTCQPIIIGGRHVEIVNSFKYLGIILDCILNL